MLRILKLLYLSLQMDTWKYLKTLSLAWFNITAVTLTSNLVLYPLAKMRGIHFDGNSLPSLTEYVYYFVISLLLLEIYFYYGHRSVNYYLPYSINLLTLSVHLTTVE